MARKVTFEKNYIIDKSVDFIKEKGIDNLSVRELTKFIGCSTQPIFRLYDNMDIREILKPQSLDEIYEKITEAKDTKAKKLILTKH